MLIRGSMWSLSLCALLALAQAGMSPVLAQEADENGKPSGKANGKSNGAAGEGEEDGKDKKASGEWEYKAILNRAFLFSNDGGRTVRFVDNDQDNTAIGVEREMSLGGGWKLGFKTGGDFKWAGSDRANQERVDNRLIVKIGDFVFELGHERYGKLAFGHADSASDGVGDNAIKLLNSSVLANGEIENWNSSYFLRTPAIGLTPLKWGDFFPGPQVGETGRFIVYSTPKFKGFEIKFGVGQPQDFVIGAETPFYHDKIGGVVLDTGIYYSDIWNKTLRVKGSLGAIRDTTRDRHAIEKTHDVGTAGGFALMHLPTGLNLAFNTGITRHIDQCAEPGVVSGQCRGADRFAYVKGGIVVKPFSWGPTDFYGEYYRGTRSLRESDETVLRALEVGLDTAEELRSSTMRMWGLGVVQSIDKRSEKSHSTDLYIGFRRYSLDTELIGAGGGAVASQKVKDFSAVMAGIRFRWGKAEKED